MRPRDNLGSPRAAARKRWAACLSSDWRCSAFSSIMFLFQLRQDRIASLSAATATAERLAQVLEEHTRETAASVNAVLAPRLFISAPWTGPARPTGIRSGTC